MTLNHSKIRELAAACRDLLGAPDDGRRHLRSTTPDSTILFATQEEYIRSLLADLDFEPRRHGGPTHCSECSHDHENCDQVAEPGAQPGFPNGEWLCRFCLSSNYSADPFRSQI